MKTLITGGSGLIGREFSSNYKMSSKDCNILNVAEIEELFEKPKSFRETESETVCSNSKDLAS